MIVIKKLPLAVTVLGLGAVMASAEIKVNDNFSTSGFVDMSVTGKDSGDADPTLSGSLDQYELDFMYKFGFFSARADLNGGAGSAKNATSTMFIEQAYINAALTQSLSLGMGRFLSSSGFEAAEPTGMFQYSYSKTLVYVYYQNGINLSYSSPMFGVYGAVVSDLWSPAETELMNSPGFEGQIALTPGSGITAKATMLWQMYDKDANPAKDDGQGLMTVWAQYANGPITAAVEYNQLMSWATDTVAAMSDLSGMGWLAMVNYKITDKLACAASRAGP